MARYPRLVGAEDPVDPYQLQDPTHDPNSFYTFCGKESSSMTTRVPVEYINIIGALVASREIPDYQTPADFVRDAIHHRIYWYTNHYDKRDIADHVNVFTQMERSRERERAMTARKEAVVQFRQEFYEALTQESVGACQAVVDEVNLALESRDSIDDSYKRNLQMLALEMKTAMSRFTGRA